MQLIVLGMHRSGTSGVTRLLNMAGAWFGPAGIATEPNEENPKGFWERRDVRAVCDDLLHAGGFDWWKIAGFSLDAIPEQAREEQLAVFSEIVAELDEHRPWVVKEPRLCLLLPLLLPLLDSPVCIHVSREPLEVAQSVAARGNATASGGLALWEAYTLAAFEASRGLPRLIVSHHDVMADPVGTTSRLVADLAELGVQGLHLPSADEITGFITPDLHRQRRRAVDRDLRLNRAQEHLAGAVDDHSILDVDRLPSLSEGAADALVEIEWGRARLADIAALEREVAAAREEAAQQAAAADRRIAVLSQRLRAEEDRRRRVGDRAVAALDQVERDVRAHAASTTGRIGAYLLALRRSLTPGMSRKAPGPVGRTLTGIDIGRREVRGLASDDDDTDEPDAVAIPRLPPITRSQPSARRTGRAKVAVLTWDAGHNPIGRANVLAEVLARHFDVEIWGAQFERYGSRVWAPLRHGRTAINTFAGLPFPAHLAQMEAIAGEIDADAVWVSKPRLPSYLLGALVKESRNRPLVLDVDDHELAFFAEDEGLDIGAFLGRRTDPELMLPFERAWTRACDPLIGAADLVTVSNPTLQARYGGTIVPHARDEHLFDPDRYDRDRTRSVLGIHPETRLLLFGGTPRVHKGIVDILAALDEIGDDRYRVLMFGTRELDELRPGLGGLERWAMALPYQPFEDLPRIVGAADLACVLQDPSHPVSRYQMPAKLTDALAMGVPTLVSAVPPVQHLVDQGVLNVVEPGGSLAATITSLFDDHGAALDRAAQGRKVFLESYSYEAVGRAIAPLFDELIADPPEPSPALAPLIDVPRALYGRRAAAAQHAALPATPRFEVRQPGTRDGIEPGDTFDVVMFWKQNDTGLYGRRQDMFLEHLRRSGRVGTVVHFDNPVTPESLLRTYQRSRGAQADQGRMVVRQTLGRVAHRHDGEHLHQHTFLYGGRRSARLGFKPRSAYVDHVLDVLRGHHLGTGKRPLVLWAFPTNPDLPTLIDALDPDLVVADVVDDNRTWYAPGSPHHDRVEQNYRDVLARADVVIANCEPVAESMREFAPRVEVVPNGLQMPDGSERGPRPRELAGLTGPIIGYVGNLSSRIDIDLLDDLAVQHAGWQFVFVGSAHLDEEILRLDRLPNVHFLGVRPHTEAKRLMAHFDVALIPHVDNEMTRAMNPLKAYVYASVGVPVVATPVANLDDLAGVITVAEGADGFAEAIEARLAEGRDPIDLDSLRPHSWDERVRRVLELIDEAAAGDASGDADLPGRHA